MDGTLSIALVSREYPPFYGGGIGTYARWIVPALTEQGVRVHVVTEAHDRVCPRVEHHGLVSVHRVPVTLGPGGWASAAMSFSVNAGRKIRELYERGVIDIAEFAECEAAGAATQLMNACSTHVPTVVHLHTPSEVLHALRSFSSKPVDAILASYFLSERLSILSADRVCAPSRFIADWAQGAYDLVETPCVIPYAVGPVVDAIDLPESPSALYIGRIEPRKGIEVLIRAWECVLDYVPDATLRLAGGDTATASDGGSFHAYLVSLMSDRVRESVSFLGRLRSGSLDAEYARASVCVIPSLWENFPNTCIESMTRARPVVVSENGGMAEMVGATEAGEVVPVGESQPLAEAIVRTLQLPQSERTRRGLLGRQQILKMCDPKNVANQRVAMYLDTIRRAQQRGHHAEGTRMNARSRAKVWSLLRSMSVGDLDLYAPPVFKPAVAQWVTPVQMAVGGQA